MVSEKRGETIDMIIAIKQLQEKCHKQLQKKCIKQHQDWYLLFRKYTKTFNTASRHGLEKQGIGPCCSGYDAPWLIIMHSLHNSKMARVIMKIDSPKPFLLIMVPSMAMLHLHCCSVICSMKCIICTLQYKCWHQNHVEDRWHVESDIKERALLVRHQREDIVGQTPKRGQCWSDIKEGAMLVQH